MLWEGDVEDVDPEGWRTDVIWFRDGGEYIEEGDLFIKQWKEYKAAKNRECQVFRK